MTDRRKNQFRDSSTWTPEFREGVMRRLQLRDEEFFRQCQIEFNHPPVHRTQPELLAIPASQGRRIKQRPLLAHLGQLLVVLAVAAFWIAGIAFLFS